MLPRPSLTTRKTLASLKFPFFSRYWCKQTTIQLYFLFCDVKCHHSSQSFKKCHDTHKNSQLCCWNNPGTFFSPETLCYILHEKLLQIHVSKALPSVNPGSCDIDGLTLVTFSSNWNKVDVCFKKKKRNECKKISVLLTTKAEFFIVTWTREGLFRSLFLLAAWNDLTHLFKVQHWHLETTPKQSKAVHSWWLGLQLIQKQFLTPKHVLCNWKGD